MLRRLYGRCGVQTPNSESFFDRNSFKLIILCPLRPSGIHNTFQTSGLPAVQRCTYAFRPSFFFFLINSDGRRFLTVGGGGAVPRDYYATILNSIFSDCNSNAKLSRPARVINGRKTPCTGSTEISDGARCTRAAACRVINRTNKFRTTSSPSRRVDTKFPYKFNKEERI